MGKSLIKLWFCDISHSALMSAVRVSQTRSFRRLIIIYLPHIKRLRAGGPSIDRANHTFDICTTS